jgi:hypothetical protein
MADPPKRRKHPPKPGLHGFLAKYPDRTLSRPWELRNLFSEANILEREREGELVQKVIHRGEFDVSLRGETDYVRTVITEFVKPETGESHARTHHYERRDGSIAASGQRDPKRVLWQGRLYFID